MQVFSMNWAVLTFSSREVPEWTSDDPSLAFWASSSPSVWVFPKTKGGFELWGWETGLGWWWFNVFILMDSLFPLSSGKFRLLNFYLTSCRLSRIIFKITELNNNLLNKSEEMQSIDFLLFKLPRKIEHYVLATMLLCGNK